MPRHLLTATLVTVAASIPFAAPAPAAVTLSVDADTYTPGESIGVRVELPPISALASYTIDVLIRSPDGTAGTAGTDYAVDTTTSGNAPSGAIFPDHNFAQFAGINPDGGIFYSVTNDTDPASVDVTDANNIAAVFHLRTAATFTGPLILRIDADNLILDQPGIPFQSVEGFDLIVADTLAAGAITLRAIPEPASAALFAPALIAVTTRRRRSRICPSSDGEKQLGGS